jgi:hypothetical protein
MPTFSPLRRPKFAAISFHGPARLQVTKKTQIANAGVMAGCKGVINTEGNTGDETEEISVARMSEKIDKRLVTEEEQRAQGILLNEMWNWSSP